MRFFAMGYYGLVRKCGVAACENLPLAGVKTHLTVRVGNSAGDSPAEFEARRMAAVAVSPNFYKKRTINI